MNVIANNYVMLLGYNILHVFEYFLEMALLMPLPDMVPIYMRMKPAHSKILLWDNMT